MDNYNETYFTTKQAEKYDMQVNSDIEHVLCILGRLGKNQIKYGKPFCPCLPDRCNDSVCPCKQMRENRACRCGLYLPKENKQ